MDMTAGASGHGAGARPPRAGGGGRGAVQDDEEGGEIPGVLFWSLAWHATTSACYDYRLAMHDLDVAFHLIGITHSWQACMR